MRQCVFFVWPSRGWRWMKHALCFFAICWRIETQREQRSVLAPCPVKRKYKFAHKSTGRTNSVLDECCWLPGLFLTHGSWKNYNISPEIGSCMMQENDSVLMSMQRSIVAHEQTLFDLCACTYLMCVFRYQLCEHKIVLFYKWVPVFRFKYHWNVL